MTEKVITRFAPSPTGFLHIGGARTALFNWLFARTHNGKMLLRIEDTDRERSTQEAIDAILEGLTWLGLDWDDAPIFQFSRAERHRQVAEQLLAKGHAYRCYCSQEELEMMRDNMKQEGRLVAYDGTWRDRDPADAPDDVTPVVRFKAPREGNTTVNDVVQGRVVIENKQLDDLILLRSDGTPTYMLSVVVDDYDMGITHIIRGDDHLTNAARQSQIYAALGWDTPVFAHIPLIHGSDGAKLSKRHGALGAEAYRDLGYLPEAMRNYLVRLGWSHGDDEIFSTEQAIEWFSLDAIGKSPARFDISKLDYINGHYLRLCEDDKLIQHLRIIWDKIDINTLAKSADMSDKDWALLKAALPSVKERAKTLIELVENTLFLFAPRPLVLSDKAAKTLNESAQELLLELLNMLKTIDEWTLVNIENSIKEFAAHKNLKFGKIAQPLRAALTGGLASPGIYDIMVLLGREESLTRIEEQT